MCGITGWVAYDDDLTRHRDIAMTEEDNFNRYVRHLRKSIEASHAS